MWHQRCVGIGLSAIAAIWLTSCSQKSDASKIEAILKAELAKQNGISLKAVKCPADFPSGADQEFECTGELDPDGGFFIQVKASAETDQVDWDIPHSWRLLNLAKLESEFQQGLIQAKLQDKPQNSQTSTKDTSNQSDQSDPNKSPRDLKVDCGGGYRVVKPGDSFECKVVHGQAGPLQNTRNLPAKNPDRITVKIETNGNVTWQEIREVAVASAINGLSVETQSTDPQTTEPQSGQPQVAIGSTLEKSPSTPSASPSSASPSTSEPGVLESAPQDETGWQELGD